MAQIARSHGPECVETLVKAMRDENAPWPTRCAAASAILDRGHGKPVSVIDMSVTTDRPVATLTTVELEQIIAEQNALPIIEGEYSTVSNTVPTHAEVVS